MNSQVPALSWGHININVSNLDESIVFYEKLGFNVLLQGIPYLGLTASSGSDKLPATAALALDMSQGSEGRGCIMQLDDGFPKIDLTEWSNVDQQKPLHNADLGLVRVCLASRDLAEDYAKLLAQGVTFVSAPQATQDGKADIALCVDPDGTLVELIQLHLDRW